MNIMSEWAPKDLTFLALLYFWFSTMPPVAVLPSMARYKIFEDSPMMQGGSNMAEPHACVPGYSVLS